MADRVLRSSIIGSEKLSRVGDQAALLYDRLLCVADDFGLIELSAVSLRLRAVPGRESYTLAVVEACCAELLEVELLRGYDVEGKRYAAITNWNQTRWSKKSRFPMPPWGEEHIAGGYKAPRARETDPAAAKAAPAAGKSKINGEPAKFPMFWDIYPRHEARAAAVRAWIKLNPDDALIGRIIEAIERQGRSGGCLAAHSTPDGRSTIPHPASWLNARRWEDEAAAPVHHEPKLAI